MTVPGMPTMSSSAGTTQFDKNLDCKAWKRTGYCPNFTASKQTCQYAHRPQARGTEKGKGKGKGEKGMKGDKGGKGKNDKGKKGKGKGKGKGQGKKQRRER